MSGSSETHKEISDKVGHKTVESVTINDKTLDINTSRTKQASEEKILTPERIATLLEGETIVIRTLHRQDRKRRKNRPFPIFNTKETSMPYRYQFLGDDFDTNKDINDFLVPSEHTHLDLVKNSINFEKMLERVKNNESIIQSDDDIMPPKPAITEESLKEYMETKGVPEETIRKMIDKIGQNFNEEFVLKDIISKLSSKVGDSEVESYLYKYAEGLKIVV